VKSALVAVALILGCKSPPPAESGSGSGLGSGSGSVAKPIDAPKPTAKEVLDTVNATMAKLTISDDGVGPITLATKPAELVTLYPGATSDHKEAEDYSFDVYSVGPADKPILTAITNNGGDGFFKVTVLGGNFATAEGVGVGTTISELAAKYPDLACKFAKYGPNPEDFVEALFCETPKYKHLTFNLDTKGWKKKPGKVEVAAIATRTVQKILWVPKPEP
jgi:hypothetical protein